MVTCMSALQSILREEKQRLERLCRKYRLEMAKLPKGTISMKERKDRYYAYLVYRERGKIIFKYLGGSDSDKVRKIRERIKSRKKLEPLFKRAQGSLKEIKKALHE